MEELISTLMEIRDTVKDLNNSGFDVSDDEISAICEKYNFKFLGCGSSRFTVLTKNRCFKISFYGGHCNHKEFERSNLIKNSRFAESFALVLKKHNDFINEVEYVKGKTLNHFYDLNNSSSYYDLFDKAELVVREVSKDLGIKITDSHGDNFMLTSTGKIMVVDYAT